MALFGVRSPVPAWHVGCANHGTGPGGGRTSTWMLLRVPGGATPSGAWEVILGQRTCCFIPRTPQTCRSAGEGNRGCRASQEPCSCFQQLGTEGREQVGSHGTRVDSSWSQSSTPLPVVKGTLRAACLSTAPIFEPGCPAWGPDSAPSSRLGHSQAQWDCGDDGDNELDKTHAAQCSPQPGHGSSRVHHQRNGDGRCARYRQWDATQS